MGVGPFQRGDKLSAAEMNEIARAVVKIMRLSGGKFIQVTHTADGTTLRLATADLGAYLSKTPRGFWARLTSEAAGGDGKYSWIRLQDDGATDHYPAETGTDNAKEVQETEGLPVGAAGVGTVVWLERTRPADPADPDEWRFTYERLLSGTADKQMVAWDETTDKAWELILPDGVNLDVNLATGKLVHIVGPHVYGAEPGGALHDYHGFSLDANGHTRQMNQDGTWVGPAA